MKRNVRRVPTAQRVRVFYRFFHRLMRWLRPIVTIAVLFIVIRVAWTQFAQSKRFGLKKVTTSGSLPQHELMQFAGLKWGTNILQLDIKKLSKRLQKHPQIKSVHVRRRFPNTLHIRVVTHKAVAVAELGGHYYHIDKKGRPFARVARHKGSKQLPLLSGVQRAEYERAPQATQRLFRRSLSLVRAYKHRKLTQYQALTEVQYDPVLGYILRTGHGKIYIGRKHFPERMKQLDRIYRLFWKRGVRKFRYVRLDHRRHPRRVIVKLDDAVLVTQPTDTRSKNGVVHANLNGH